MKVVFIANNKNNRLAKLLRKLEADCIKAELSQVRFMSTRHPKHAIELAAEATEEGCDFLIAIGGDGTLHEVINGIMRSNAPAHKYPAVGLLPYGSANDFARSVHISNSIAELIALIRTNSVQLIDLGKIVLHPTSELRYFINIAGLGLSPVVVRNLSQSSGSFDPGIHYFKNILKGFRTYSKKAVTCTTSTWQWKGKLLQMAVANGRYFGNGICIAPNANVTDGRFQIAIFGDLSIWYYLKNIINLKKGLKLIHPDVSYYIADEVSIESNDACGIEADGEYVGLAPATITLLPKAIEFLMHSELK